MSSKQTDNLGLHSWERTDAFLMDEFNDNFSKLDQAVGGKADKTALAAETDARQGALNALSGQVNKKADQTALAAETAAREAALNALTGQVNKKADQTALAAETAAREAALSALTGRVGTLERGRVLWKLGEYTGDGTHGKTKPRRLEFDFKPLVVIVADSVDWPYGGFPWINGLNIAHNYLSSGNAAYVTLTWEDRAIEFCDGNSSSATAERNLDRNGRVYKYFALGVAE